MKMEFTLLHVLSMLTCVLTRELVTVGVVSNVTAQCGQQMTLHCNVSSLKGNLSVHYLAWLQNGNPLCVVDNNGQVTNHSYNTPSSFQCSYTQEQLTITFEEVQPMDSGDYLCKLRSRQGLGQRSTRVQLQECYRDVEDVVTPEGPNCTFRRVYPDGDVHWFRGSTKLAGDQLTTKTTKQVEAGGWVTISSSLGSTNMTEPYNCSLWNPTSGRYIASRRVKIPVYRGEGRRSRNGAGAQGPLWTFPGVLFLTGLTILS
ncbi:uncharacterized protein ACJ7VT_018696 [Polymixia lowei]